MKTSAVFVLAISFLPMCVAQQPVNAGAALVGDFNKRVEDYMKIHKNAASKFPMKPTDRRADTIAHREGLATAIREARPQAARGEIFTPEITAEFRRLIDGVMQGNRAARIDKSMKRSEPVHLDLKVNDSYPEKVPLQSTPPTLLLSLPRLPAGLEYRIVGKSLVLRDADANLIVDFAPDLLR